MILADYSICSDPQGYPLCGSCRRNLANHAEPPTHARQRHIAPDNRENCRHWDAHWDTYGPEDKL